MSQNIKAKETYYDGYRFRSRLEARWAVFFNNIGLEYEMEGFDIRRCVLERIEDEFDLETYRKSLEAYKTLPSSYTLDEVKSEILNQSR